MTNSAQPLLCEGVAHIPDPALKASINVILYFNSERYKQAGWAELNTKIPVACSHLKQITGLDAHLRNIVDLTGLQFATNLDVLRLENNRIEDIAALSQLTELERLTLDHNAITDLRPLVALKKLTELSLVGNRAKLESLKPIAELPNLESLHLSTPGGLNVEPLSVLFKLEELTLLAADIDNAKSLIGLPVLKQVRFILCPKSDSLTSVSDVATVLLEQGVLVELLLKDKQCEGYRGPP